MSGEHGTPSSAVEAGCEAHGHQTGISDERWWEPGRVASGSLEGIVGSKDKQGLRELGDTEVLWEGGRAR